ncbi:carbohydrate ABC transporter permease [Dehalococcoidia bacterium]|nr:carbohydrate ABC transporter permease [Dehalococcoidia bacterium]
MAMHTVSERATRFHAVTLQRQRQRQRTLKVVLYGFLLITGLPIVVGYAWLFINSFSDVLVFGLIPERLTLENWTFLWEAPSPWYPCLWRTFANTLLLALGMVVVTVGISTPAAYVLSRMKFPGRAAFLAGTLILHGFPGITLLISLFFVLRFLGLLDSVVGVFLIRASLMMPFAIWVMKGFFDNIPWDVERAALVDGATRLQTWYKVMLPQVKPGIGAISIFAFLAGWAEFIFVITFIGDRSNWTLTSYVNAIVGDFRFLDYGLLAATSLFYMFPVLLFFLFAQKYLLEMSVGGMKGGG